MKPVRLFLEETNPGIPIAKLDRRARIRRRARKTARAGIGVTDALLLATGAYALTIIIAAALGG